MKSIKDIDWLQKYEEETGFIADAVIGEHNTEVVFFGAYESIIKSIDKYVKDNFPINCEKIKDKLKEAVVKFLDDDGYIKIDCVETFFNDVLSTLYNSEDEKN
jgi:DNA-directed RNA polymerase specialized sigma54-like protein